MARLVIECFRDGSVYVLEETEKHHRKAQTVRRNWEWERRTLESLPHDCRLYPGQYVVIPLVEVD